MTPNSSRTYTRKKYYFEHLSGLSCLQLQKFEICMLFCIIWNIFTIYNILQFLVLTAMPPDEQCLGLTLGVPIHPWPLSIIGYLYSPKITLEHNVPDSEPFFAILVHLNHTWNIWKLNVYGKQLSWRYTWVALELYFFQTGSHWSGASVILFMLFSF